jgi:hypothetical protein
MSPVRSGEIYCRRAKPLAPSKGGKTMTNRQLLVNKADTLTESEAAEALEYIAIMESMNEMNVTDLIAEKELLLVTWLMPLHDRSWRQRTAYRPGGWRSAKVE